MNNKALLTVCLLNLLLAPLILFSQSTAKMVSLQSPNQKINVALLCQQNSDQGDWYIKASYNNNGKNIVAIPRIDVGLSRSDQDFSKELKFLKVSKPILKKTIYSAACQTFCLQQFCQYFLINVILYNEKTNCCLRSFICYKVH